MVIVEILSRRISPDKKRKINRGNHNVRLVYSKLSCEQLRNMV